MQINREFISQQNISGTGNPCRYIVIHETDNFRAGADARAHAKSQHDGNFADMSVHYYCGSDGVYQAAEHTCQCWHIGREYGGNHSVWDATNNNSIGIEICVNEDGDYSVARQNAIELVKYLLQTTGIPASRVIRHYDAKGKYCPRNMMDNPALWEDFKAQIQGGGSSGNTSYCGQGIGTATCTDDGVRIRTGAGTDYTILDSVNTGTQVEVLEKTGNWYKIVWPGASAGYAYTCADYYDYSGASSEPPAAETCTQVPGDRVYEENRINYRVHQEKAGWLPHVEDGQTAGITGKALRLEAIKIDCKLAGVKIKAKAHIQKKGTVDYGYITSDTVIGTTGEKLRLEGIELEAEGLPAGMQLYLRYHIQTEGWSDWITGAMAGTAGLGKRLEAIQIKIC